MAKKTLFTTITPLPAGVGREVVYATLHDHIEMIDLNPSHESRAPCRAPPEASPEEYHCQWYEITDKVAYLPANMYTGQVSFKSCFHDLANGVQIHVYAPMGLEIKQKWTLGGNLPHEPVMPREIGVGAPVSGLFLREDVEIKCNFLMTRFVRKTFKQSLATLVARLVIKAQLQEAEAGNHRLHTRNASTAYDSVNQHYAPQLSPPMSSPGMSYGSLSPPLTPRIPLTPPPPTNEPQFKAYNPAKWEEQEKERRQSSLSLRSQHSVAMGQGPALPKERMSYPGGHGYVPQPQSQRIHEMEDSYPAELAG